MRAPTVLGHTAAAAKCHRFTGRRRALGDRPTREASAYLTAVTHRWWIAGGWALDLFVGAESRPHKDLDIGILRRDAAAVMAGMSSFEFFEAMAGKLYRLEGDAPSANVHCLWARPVGSDQWLLELLLDESEHGDWVFRRDSRIRYPLDLIVQYDSNQIPYVAPEIQLLYKASRTRPEDEADFQRTVPHLSPRARAWLRRAVAILDPDHRWLRPLGD
jgi:hypothetical protein